MKIKYKGKKIDIEVKECNSDERFKGLMVVQREKAQPLLFDFKRQTKVPIHSLFVFFPFITIWLDGKNNVIQIKKVSPFSLPFTIPQKFTKIIEIPLNNKYVWVWEIFDMNERG